MTNRQPALIGKRGETDLPVQILVKEFDHAPLPPGSQATLNNGRLFVAPTICLHEVSTQCMNKIVEEQIGESFGVVETRQNRLGQVKQSEILNALSAVESLNRSDAAVLCKGI